MKKNSIITILEESLPKERVKAARKEAQQEILKIRLADLRRQMNINQDNVKGFSQVGISNLEHRKDLKISTLVNYLHAIGMKVEIKAFPVKKSPTIPPEIILLRM
jgi:hypothetical protein